MDKEKLNDIICDSSSDYDILNNAYTYIENLEQQCKKQQEVIDKIYEFIKELYDNTDDTTCYEIDRNRKIELLDILNEGKNE